MGLLLVTKLLDKGSDTRLQGAFEALGDEFLGRLLLPLQDSWVGTHCSGLPEEVNTQTAWLKICRPQQVCYTPGDEVAQVGLALAVLAGFCRSPQLAQEDGLVQFIPLLCKVRALLPAGWTTSCTECGLLPGLPLVLSHREALFQSMQVLRKGGVTEILADAGCPPSLEVCSPQHLATNQCLL